MGKHSNPEKRKRSREKYDWEAITSEYRRGQLSNVAIGLKYGLNESTIRTRMKKDGITKDLANRVQRKVREQLVTYDSREKELEKLGIDDEVIVDVAAARAVQVIRGHQHRILEGHRVCKKLMSQLNDAIKDRKRLNKEIDANAGMNAITLKAAIDIPKHAQTVVALTTAMKNLITLERQTFNLDDGRTPQETASDQLDEILNRINEQGRNLPGRLK